MKKIRTGRRGRPVEWPIVRPRGGAGWIVDCGTRLGGPRLRKSFRTREDADAWALEKRDGLAAEQAARKFEAGNRAVRLTHLPDGLRADLLTAVDLLAGGKKGSIVEAVKFYLAHHAPAGERAVEQVVAELLAATARANRRPRTILDLRNRLALFAGDHRGRGIHTLTGRDVETWLDKRTAGTSATTRRNFFAVLHRLFTFAQSRGYIEGVPLRADAKPKIERRAPAILTPAEAERLMRQAEKKHGGRMTAYYAIGMFAGLRPENELRGLRWEDVDQAEGMIHVRAASSKTRRDRFVQIEPTLARWLLPHALQSGPIFFSRRAHRKVVENARIDWSPDLLRHTCASYKLARGDDPAAVAAGLGHTGGVGTLFAHYRAIAKPQAAAEFWKIAPAVDRQAAGGAAAAS